MAKTRKRNYEWVKFTFLEGDNCERVLRAVLLTRDALEIDDQVAAKKALVIQNAPALSHVEVKVFYTAGSL